MKIVTVTTVQEYPRIVRTFAEFFETMEEARSFVDQTKPRSWSIAETDNGAVLDECIHDLDREQSILTEDEKLFVIRWVLQYGGFEIEITANGREVGVKMGRLSGAITGTKWFLKYDVDHPDKHATLRAYSLYAAKARAKIVETGTKETVWGFVYQNKQEEAEWIEERARFLLPLVDRI